MRRFCAVFAWLVVFLGMSTLSAQLNLSVVPNGPSNPVIGLPGSAFGASVVLDSDQPSQGWSYGICHDELLISLDAQANGAATDVVNNGGPPDFNEVTVFSNGVTVGVVISFTGAATLPAGSGAELQVLDYSVFPGVAQPMSGDPDLVTSIAPCDILGIPPVATVVVINGASEVPGQSGFDVVIPAEAECELICVGGVDNVELSWNNCNPGGPADYYMLFRDGELLGLFPDGTQSFSDTMLAPGPYHYELLAVTFPDPQGPPSILQGACDVDVIPVTLVGVSPAVGLYQGGTSLTVTGTGFLAAPNTTVMIGSQSALDIVVVDDSTITCTTPAVDTLGLVDVSVTNSLGNDSLVEAFLYGFQRGLVNDDLMVDLGDTVYTLQYLFADGPEPFCLDAADFNDDALLDVADPVYNMNFLFMGGPEPPAPFVEPGLDPTMDGFGCGNTPPMP